MVNIKTMKLQVVRENTVKYDGVKRISGDRDAADIFRALGLFDCAEEELWMLCLNAKNEVSAMFMVSRGSLSSSIVHPREVFKRAIASNAMSIIVGHNHPSGDSYPSQEDINITRKLKDAGEILGVKLLDHIILGEDSYNSLIGRV